HGGVRYSQTSNAVHAKLWVDNCELVHAHLASTNCVSKTCRCKSSKFANFPGTRPGPRNEFAFTHIVEGVLTAELTRRFDGAHNNLEVVIRAEIVAVDHSGIL